ncbi:MAG: hypothetical protein IJN29_02155 [Akkermansia sp.]|nr:hypothetical protein [Akkermansia sp.]
MRKNTFTLCIPALLALSGCGIARPDTPPALPEGIAHAAGIMPLSDSWVSCAHYLSGENCCLEVKLDSEDLPRGRTLELQLCGTPYSTASGSKWQQPIASISKPGKYIYSLSKNDFRKSGGPYDYSVIYTLRDSKGKELDSQHDRLSDFIPGPGWEAYYEKENRERLQQLQSAAERCATMRLVLTYHEQGIYGTEVALPLHGDDAEELRRLIGRMRPIKTHLHEIIPLWHTELILLNADGRELERMDPSDVVGEKYVSPEDLASLSCYALSNEDAATWKRITLGAEVKAAIDTAVQKAQENRRKPPCKRK